MNAFVVKLVNNLIRSYLPKINDVLSKNAQKYDIDPLIEVASGKQVIGSLSMGVTTVEAVARYSIDNLEGLSSIELTQLAISSEKDYSEKKDRLTTDFLLKARFNKPLTADLNGKLSVRPSLPKMSQSISGSASFKGVILSATGTVSASVKLSSMKASLKSIQIKVIALSYDDERIKLSKLGIFTPLKIPIQVLLKSETKKLADKISSEQMRDLLNAEIAKLIHN